LFLRAFVRVHPERARRRRQSSIAGRDSSRISRRRPWSSLSRSLSSSPPSRRPSRPHLDDDERSPELIERETHRASRRTAHSRARAAPSIHPAVHPSRRPPTSRRRTRTKTITIRQYMTYTKTKPSICAVSTDNGTPRRAPSARGRGSWVSHDRSRRCLEGHTNHRPLREHVVRVHYLLTHATGQKDIMHAFELTPKQ